MQKKIFTFWTLFVSAMMISGLLGVSLSFGQEMPTPGTVIDKSNYKKYAYLFPEEWAPAFEDGFGGLLPLFIMKVAETRHYPMPKAFLDYSARNKGKYSIDAKGNISPAYNREGLPFLDLQPADKDFALKLMWNYDSRYQCDESMLLGKGGSFEKRRGEDIRVNQAMGPTLFFKNRMALSPKPDLANPIGLYKAGVFQYTAPESIKNTIMLSYRYVDQNRPDDTYLYLPSLRRVIRAESGQRSTPVLGSTQALDDFGLFDGRIPEFTYTIVKEQKILAVPESKMTLQIAMAYKKKNELPVDTEGYEIRDVYAIDIKPKDAKYPQSKKRIYIDKENLWPYYAIAWDRAGKLWKIWFQTTKSHPMPGGQKLVFTNGLIGIDLQFGMATQFVTDFKVNTDNFTYNDVTPQALLKRAR